MRRAAIVSERVIGQTDEGTLRILLEVLRLLIRSSSWSPASSLLSSYEEETMEVRSGPGSSLQAFLNL